LPPATHSCICLRPKEWWWWSFALETILGIAADTAIGCGTSMGLFSMPPISLLAEWKLLTLTLCRARVWEWEWELELELELDLELLWLCSSHCLFLVGARSYTREKLKTSGRSDDPDLHSGVAQIPLLFLVFSRKPLAAQIARMRAG